MPATVVLFNRDLRIHDHPALAAACRESDAVIPLFVVDDRIASSAGSSPNRAALLVDALEDLRASLRARSGDLIVRFGDPATEAVAIARAAGAGAIFASADVSPFAHRREAALAAASREAGIEVRLFPGVTVVPPRDVLTKAGTPYRVFTPYFRAWQATPRRPLEPAPDRVPLPSPTIDPGPLPTPEQIASGTPSPRLPRGGETEARSALSALAASSPSREGDEDLASDHASRLGAALHLGWLSPLEVASTLTAQPALVRSLAWRDYFHQLLHHEPRIAAEDYRPRRAPWRNDPAAFDAFEAWRDGRTGIPIVDAAMRQLLEEGWMHNRLRMVVASFLTKHLGIDWRLGAAHFMRWLVDGDVANNAGNWQWVAGTGTDTRPNRILNPVRQAQRFDPSGDYVRRYVPELASLTAREIHEPWRLDDERGAALAYPDRILDHEAAAAAFRERVS